MGLGLKIAVENKNVCVVCKKEIVGKVAYLGKGEFEKKYHPDCYLKEHAMYVQAFSPQPK